MTELLTCSSCGHHPVAVSAAACPKCGAPVATQPGSIKPPKKRRIWLWALLGLLGFSCVGSAIGDWVESRERRERAEANATRDRQKADSLSAIWSSESQEILAASRTALASGRGREAQGMLEPFDGILTADERKAMRPLMDSVWAAAAEEGAAAEEQRILTTLRDVPAADAAQNLSLYEQLLLIRPSNQRYRERADHYRGQVQTAARKAFAASWESSLLDDYIDARITTRGADATTIRLQYVLVSRVWAHNMAKTEVLTNLRTLGFKRFEITDGFNETYYWDL